MTTHNSKQKTILIIANSSWNIYNFRLPLIKQFQALGHRIIVVSVVDEYTKRVQKLGCDFVALNDFNALNTGLINNIKTLIEFNKIIKTYNPDIILSFTIKPNIFSGLVTMFKKIAFYPTLTGLGSLFIVHEKPHFWLKLLYKRALKKAKKVVFHNLDDLNEFVKQNFIRAEKAIVIPGSGVDTVKFNYSPLEDHGRIIFLCIARLINEKGVDLFIEASGIILQKYPDLDIEFRLFGTLNSQDPRSISEASLSEWNNSDKCYYGGFIENIENEIKHASVFVLPTLREGMPRAILESMSIGRPVISSDVPGSRQVVEHDKNGLLVQPNNVQSLMDAILKMVKMTYLERDEMGKQGHRLVIKKYGTEIIVKQYESLIMLNNE